MGCGFLVLLPATVPTPLSGVQASAGGHMLQLSVLQLLSNSLSLVSFMSLATVLLYPTLGECCSMCCAVEVLARSAGSLGGGDSLESDLCRLSRPFRRTLRRFIRLCSGGGGDELLLSDSGGSTRRDSPSESRDPLIGVGIMLTRFCGMLWLPFWFRGDIGRLLTDWSSSESTSTILNSPDVLWPL